MTSSAAPDPSPPPLPPDVVEALQRGQTIEAIRLLRNATGLGLKEAKQAVDVYAREQQVGADPHRAPGEVPRRAGIGWLVLALLLVAAVLLLRRLLAGPG